MISIRNSFYSYSKKKINKNHVDYSSINYEEEIEKKLEIIECDNNDSINYFNELEFLTVEIFTYLNKNYNDRQLYIFKCYFLNNKMTYNKLSKMTGYSVGFCAELIKKIKIDLRKNLINFINDKRNN